MTDDRLPIAVGQAAALFRAQRERSEDIHQRGLDQWVNPDPAEMPPWPPCPVCGVGVESYFGGLYERPGSPGAGLKLHLDVEPCGHRMVAEPCSEDVFDA